MVRRFIVSSRKTRVGIVIYSTRQRRVISMTQVRGRRSVYRILGGIRYYGGRRYTGRALNYAKRYLFVGKPQCGKKRVLIVLTSGVSVDRVLRPSKGLALIGVEIFAVITTRRAVRQIQKITTTRYHVYVASYNNLVGITDRLKNKICVTPRGKKCFTVCLFVVTISYEKNVPFEKL